MKKDWNPTPYFSFSLSAPAARIQTSVWLHTLFSGEPAGDPALQHAALLRPVREQRAGRGGDFSFWSDLIFFSPPETELFPVFLRAWQISERWSRRVGAQPPADLFVLALRLRGNGLISVFFLRPLPRPSWENSPSNLQLSLPSYMFHPASFKSTWLRMFLHILGLWTFFFLPLVN